MKKGLMKKGLRDKGTKGPRVKRSFTLIEALIAVAILVVIILFTSKIFSSVSHVTTAGQANSDAMQDAAAIELQIRQDFERLSHEGFFAIICRAVRNDILIEEYNLPSSVEYLLDPNRAFDEYIRSDRIVFFTQGVATGQHYVAGMGANRKAQTNAARVYYGHGFQLRDYVDRFANLTNTQGQFDFPPWDVVNSSGRIGWVVPPGAPQNTEGFFQPPAPQWTLARQAVLLGDSVNDGDNVGPPGYMYQARATDSIWNLEIRDARADAAASQLNDIRRLMLLADQTNNTPRQWIINGPNAPVPGQRDLIIHSVMYPRAEAVDLTSSGIDHDKSVHVLGTAVSDIAIDWTYEADTGFTPDPNSPTPYHGVRIGYAGQTPWFGLPDNAGELFGNFRIALPERGVFMLGEPDPNRRRWEVDPRGPVFPDRIEALTTDFYNDISIRGRNNDLDIWYIATFGYNQSQPLNPAGQPWPPNNERTYTPWPSAVRITLRVHDPGAELENGRIVQFVVKLPKRLN